MYIYAKIYATVKVHVGFREIIQDVSPYDHAMVTGDFGYLIILWPRIV